MIIPLTETQLKMLIGWLHREKDYLLSIRSMARSIILPQVDGSEEILSNTLETVNRIRIDLIRTSQLHVSEEDAELLLDSAEKNSFAEKQPFWDELKEKIREAMKVG